MTTFDLTATEYGPGSYKGCLHGPRIRVLMRSPDAAMVVGYGIHIYPHNSQYRDVTVSRESRPRTFDESQINIIDARFGNGAAAMALKALSTKGKGTVLVNGGGTPLPLPEIVQRANIEAAYAAATPTIRLPIDAKGCKQCGAQLKPFTTQHHLGYPKTDDHPRTLEDCQRLSNYPVIALRGVSISSDGDKWPFVDSFETWDGERYIDDDFCDTKCAAQYGRRAVRELPLMEPTSEIITRNYHLHESIRHYENEERTIIMDGEVFKV